MCNSSHPFVVISKADISRSKSPVLKDNQNNTPEYCTCNSDQHAVKTTMAASNERRLCYSLSFEVSINQSRCK